MNFSLLKRVGINSVVLSLARPNSFFRILQKGDKKSSCTISFSGARGNHYVKNVILLGIPDHIQ